eukprot:2218048-Pyramimonas_sp.AAC.1
MSCASGGDEVVAVAPVGEVDWHIAPVVGERPPGEAGLPMSLAGHWRLPSVPTESADLAVVHVVIIRPICHGPEVAR